MLTGNKNLDFETLKNVYHDYGRRSLTKIDDANYEILKTLDIKSLSKYCSTNQYAQQICNNDDFWQSKFISDQLPLNAILIPPSSLNEWIKEYVLVSEAYKNAFNIIAMNEVEQIRKEDKTDGILYADMGVFSMNDDIRYKILSMFITDIDFNNVYIIQFFKIDDMYTITIEELLLALRTKKIIYNQPIIYDTMINILTILLRVDMLSVADKNYLPFIFPKRYLDLLKQQRPIRYDLYHVRMIKRLGMLELLNFPK